MLKGSVQGTRLTRVLRLGQRFHFLVRRIWGSYLAKDVTSWLGNSPTVANNHYAMTMQASFDRAVAEGAKMIGMTTLPAAPKPIPHAKGDDAEVVDSKTPPTVQAKGGDSKTRKVAEVANPRNIWVCLVESLAGLPLSCPTRTVTIV
ncbi:hypothetical protein [Novipirellula artificiosorum]|uniref:Uncharacterized protein n=1 Tax=Novipirellula artificiosorum TaxID=2528016 RepID=A0A5C6D9T8_9BACT|nr:hypothetical protein [Novipirellula artificiosorum]TWU33893.1 hypothetical protein Poly41_48930 [Novipirellula artificiosorum]